MSYSTISRSRCTFYEEITAKAISYGIGISSPQRIDEINILQANYEAMRQSIKNLSVIPDILLNDAVTIPEVRIPQVPIIKGDTKSISIAAASIVAKVHRDRLMVEYDKQYPGYGFASNKGSRPSCAGSYSPNFLPLLHNFFLDIVKAVNKHGHPRFTAKVSLVIL